MSVGSFDLEGAVFSDAEVDGVRDQVALGGGFLGHGVFAGGERELLRGAGGNPFFREVVSSSDGQCGAGEFFTLPGGDFRERHVRCGRLVDWAGTKINGEKILKVRFAVRVILQDVDDRIFRNRLNGVVFGLAYKDIEHLHVGIVLGNSPGSLPVIRIIVKSILCDHAVFLIRELIFSLQIGIVGVSVEDYLQYSLVKGVS